MGFLVLVIHQKVLLEGSKKDFNFCRIIAEIFEHDIDSPVYNTSWSWSETVKLEKFSTYEPHAIW